MSAAPPGESHENNPTHSFHLIHLAWSQSHPQDQPEGTGTRTKQSQRNCASPARPDGGLLFKKNKLIVGPSIAMAPSDWLRSMDQVSTQKRCQSRTTTKTNGQIKTRKMVRWLQECISNPVLISDLTSSPHERLEIENPALQDAQPPCSCLLLSCRRLTYASVVLLSQSHTVREGQRVRSRE